MEIPSPNAMKLVVLLLASLVTVAQPNETERTIAIIKPEAVEAGNTDRIKTVIVDNGLEIIQSKKLVMSEHQATSFYGNESRLIISISKSVVIYVLITVLDTRQYKGEAFES